MTFKSEVMSGIEIARVLSKMAYDIIERNGTQDIVLCGIKTRGYPLAKRLAEKISVIANTSVTCVELDTRPYRDDKRIPAGLPAADTTAKKVIIVDDVLYTGRTARAAMEAVIAMGRPSTIQLAVLIDRGHRELPIRADYVGRNVPTGKNEIVSVSVEEVDGDNNVKLYEVV